MIDIRALELLCSRLCHDLISPVGAIRNGMEIIAEGEENGGSFQEEALQLINHAADQADARLRLFRLAYGQAGRETSGFGDARSAAQAWFATGRTKLDWPAGEPPDGVAKRRGVAKLALNLLVLADEALTHGGVIRVRGGGSATSGELLVQAEGRPGALSEELRSALNSVPPAELTPRSIHAYITGMFLRAYEIGVEIESDPGERLRLRLHW